MIKEWEAIKFNHKNKIEAQLTLKIQVHPRGSCVQTSWCFYKVTFVYSIIYEGLNLNSASHYKRKGKTKRYALMNDRVLLVLHSSSQQSFKMILRKQTRSQI